jgi:hypothetical protein
MQKLSAVSRVSFRSAGRLNIEQEISNDEVNFRTPDGPKFADLDWVQLETASGFLAPSLKD